MSQLDLADTAADEDAGPPSYTPEEVRHLIMTELSVGPVVAGLAFNVGISSAYRAARDGTFPSTRVGSKYAIPTAWIRQKLRLEPPAPLQSTPVHIVPSPPQEPAKQGFPQRHKRRHK